jgi:hypothetical protein
MKNAFLFLLFKFLIKNNKVNIKAEENKMNLDFIE